MAESTLRAIPVLDGVDISTGVTRLTAAAEPDIVSIAARVDPADGTLDALQRRLRDAFGFSLPGVGAVHRNGDGLALLGLQRDQWFLVNERRSKDPVGTVRSRLGDIGCLTDQSDSWAILDLAGPLSQAALERICTLDLAPESFGSEQVARTAMEHLSVIIERPATEQFRLYSPRSSAQSFLHAVSVSLHNVSP